MTVTYGFYNSVGGDRKYDAEDFARIFDGIIEDGVHKGIGSNFIVEAAGGPNITIGPGRAWFNHTWTLSDTAIAMTLDAAHASLNRWDAIILEVDRSDSIRVNTIKYVKGTPGSTPVKPTMTHTATLDQYPLAYIYRPLNNNTVTTANITITVGTAECPYAVSRLLDRATEPAAMHRNVFRGKYLGTSYTAGQQSAVQSGTFEDLYIGDYWTINGVNWRIVDMDYYLNIGSTSELRVSQHHLMVMPDTTLREGVMDSDFYKANSQGYYGAQMRVVHLPALGDIIWAAFPVARRLVWQQIFTSSLSNGMANSAIWSNASVEICNQQMMFGSALFIPHGRGENYPPSYQTEATRQLALFRLAPWFIRVPDLVYSGKTTQWLRDPVSPVMWACVGDGGECTYGVTTGVYGFRPIFALK